MMNDDRRKAEWERWDAIERGEVVPESRLPVTQRGRVVGSLPSDFAPSRARSNTFLYDVRPGDFRIEGETIVADPMLGPGDLYAIPGFLPSGIEEEGDV